MISDTERREVARELRELDVSDIGDADNVVDAPEDVGLLFALMLEVANDYRSGLHYAMSHFKAKDAVELFADLIDPTVFKSERDEEPKTECNKCDECVNALKRIVRLIGHPTCHNLAVKPADEFLCSECGEHVDIAYMETTDDYHAEFCPRCGAEVVE